MLIKHSKDDRNTGPKSLSEWERTYNKAIDLVSEAVAHAKTVETRVVKSVRLKPTQYALFVEGVKLLMARAGQEWDPVVELTWEGVLILEGSKAQTDSIKFDYLENAVNVAVRKTLAN
jgi:hypothetical protein